MYPIRHGIKKAENAWKYWASKATVMYTVSTLAAIVMVTALRLINGFEPVKLRFNMPCDSRIGGIYVTRYVVKFNNRIYRRLLVACIHDC